MYQVKVYHVLLSEHVSAPGHTFLHSHLVLVFQSIPAFLIPTLNSSKGTGRRVALEQPFHTCCALFWPSSRD